MTSTWSSLEKSVFSTSSSNLMVSSSPKLAIFSKFRAQPMTFPAPNSREIVIAQVPDKAVAPIMSTVKSLGKSWTRVASAIQPDMMGLTRPATWMGSQPSGTGKRFALGAFSSSAMVPPVGVMTAMKTSLSSGVLKTPSIPGIWGRPFAE